MVNLDFWNDVDVVDDDCLSESVRKAFKASLPSPSVVTEFFIQKDDTQIAWHVVVGSRCGWNLRGQGIRVIGKSGGKGNRSVRLVEEGLRSRDIEITLESGNKPQAVRKIWKWDSSSARSSRLNRGLEGGKKKILAKQFLRARHINIGWYGWIAFEKSNYVVALIY